MRRFSSREYDVIQCIIAGNTKYRDIARCIGTGEKMVQAYLLSAYRLPGVDNMAGLVLWLVDNGYITGNRIE
jgi:DNA-binding CsgD family transcriptional regulator